MTHPLLDTAAAHRIYDLAEPLSAATPHSPSHPGVTVAMLRRHGDTVREDGGSSAFEMLCLGGHTGTHIDAFCHASIDGTMLGGADIATHNGVYPVLGVETIEPFFCRGVLLDVPAALGQEAMHAGQPITAADLERTADLAGVEVREGDVVLVRTGRPLGRFADIDDPAARQPGVPGVDASGAHWLAERKVRASGSDTIAYEWLPPGKGVANMPVHTLFLCRAGIHIIEVMQLEELARDKVYEFLFVAAPLKLVGATGSPLRPLAIVM
jgi:kynurenine formamidase